MPDKVLPAIDKSVAVGGKKAIADLLRLQITTGELAPGARMPSRSELEKHFDTTKVTIQRAFEVLMEDGFIETG